MVKLCTDCKYYEKEFLGYARCSKYPSPVDGSAKDYADIERRGGWCGPNAKNFEAKPVNFLVKIFSK